MLHHPCRRMNSCAIVPCSFRHRISLTEGEIWNNGFGIMIREHQLHCKHRAQRGWPFTEPPQLCPEAGEPGYASLRCLPISCLSPYIVSWRGFGSQPEIFRNLPGPSLAVTVPGFPKIFQAASTDAPLQDGGWSNGSKNLAKCARKRFGCLIRARKWLKACPEATWMYFPDLG